MFSLFRKKPRFKVKDTVWMSTAAQTGGAIKWLEEYRNGSIVAWFREDAQTLKNALAESLRPRIISADFLNAASGPLLFWNHYPLRSAEAALAEKLGLQELHFYTALDTIFFRLFGGERMIGLMQKMGAKDDDPLEHSMISTSIRNAQDKLAKKAENEMLAGSEEEWMRLNISGERL